MSKLYQMNRMRQSAAAGGLVTSVLGGAGKLIGKIFQSKGTKLALAAGKKALANPVVQTGLMIGGAEAASALLTGGGGSRGMSGSWGRRRGRGITATELRGFRKVANLIHKEGMVSSRARGRKH
jgi:hypothetical protein